ncbi:immunoglobulin superfamily member 6 [Lithobates pipiens]
MDKPGISTLLFIKIILLYYQCGVKGCQVTMEEKNKVTECWKTIKLSCWYDAKNCPNMQVFWFRYLVSSHENLTTGSDRFIHSNDTNRVHLEIKNVTMQDSGIYICGITPRNQKLTSQNIGEGTLDVSDEKKKTFTAGNTFLIVICTLLFVYCVTVFSYYAYRSKGKFCKLKQDTDMNETGRSYKTRSIFHAIAQEYHRRYDGKTQKRNQVIENDTIYQNTSYTH